MKLYVGNLPFDFSEEDLNELFGQFGTVVSAKIVMDRYSGRSRGFAFVEMSSRSEGQQAMETLNGKPIKGRDLMVNEARQDKKPRGGRRW
jgi:RNA recognition motif-containing protein